MERLSGLCDTRSPMDTISRIEPASVHPGRVSIHRQFFHSRSFQQIVQCLIALFIFSIGGLAQVGGRGGTIANAALEDRRIIAAVDSSIHESEIDTTKLGCKVIALGPDGFFLITGLVYNKFFDSRAFAKTVFRQSKEIGGESVAQKWGSVITNELNAEMATYPHDVDKIWLSTAAVFGFVDGVGRLSMFETQLKLDKSAKIPVTFGVVEFHKGDMLNIGQTPFLDAAAEFFANVTPRARALNEAFTKKTVGLSLEEHTARWQAAGVEAAVLWNPTSKDLKLPVDALILSPQGIRWLDRKQQCYAQDYKPAPKKHSDGPRQNRVHNSN